MHFVYILQGEYGYEPRSNDDVDKFLVDKQAAIRSGQKLVKLFKVKESSNAEQVLRSVREFTDAHNSGNKPDLKDLEAAIKELIMDDRETP